MAVKNKKSPETHASDLLENPEAIAGQFSKTEEYITKHKGLVFGIAAAVAIAIAGFFGYKYYKNSQNAEAQTQMFQAVHYFESDSLELALNGDGNNLGFLDIIDEYGISDAANLAQFYAGSAYLKMGNYDEAIDYLKKFSADDLLVQGRAYSLIGDAYMEQQDYDQAADYYQKAADYKSNKEFTPSYLMKAALAYEMANNNEAAIKAYDRIIEDFRESGEFQRAKKYRARLAGSAS